MHFTYITYITYFHYQNLITTYLLVQMIEVFDRESEICGEIDGYTFSVSLIQKLTIRIQMLDMQSQNKFKGEHTIDKLQRRLKNQFKSIESFYDKIYNGYNKLDPQFRLKGQPNGVLTLIHEHKNGERYFPLKNVLTDLNKVTSNEQSIEFLHSKIKQIEKSMELQSLKQLRQPKKQQAYQMNQLALQKIKNLVKAEFQNEFLIYKNNVLQIQNQIKQIKNMLCQKLNYDQIVDLKPKIMRINQYQRQESEREQHKYQLNAIFNSIEFQSNYRKMQQDCRISEFQSEVESKFYELQNGQIGARITVFDKDIQIIFENNFKANLADSKNKADKQKIQRSPKTLSYKKRNETQQFETIDAKQLINKLQKCQYFEDFKSCIMNSTQASNNQNNKEPTNPKVTKLQFISLKEMSAQAQIEILNLVPNLKYLTLFAPFESFSQNFIDRLSQFQQLRGFYTNWSSHPSYLKLRNEYQAFIRAYGRSTDLSMQESLILSRLPNLQNIEIYNAENAQSAQVIANIKGLKHLTLGSRSYHPILDQQLVKQIYKQTELRTLSLNGVQTRSSSIVKVISKNRHLNTIVCRDSNFNNNIDDRAVEYMANLTQLQNLCISWNQLISGEGLSKLGNLKMLQLEFCIHLSQQKMKQALKNMHKLQHLKLNQNRWVDDDVMMGVQSCKELKYLNIYSTSVSGEGVKNFQGLTQLSTLICGETKIKGKDLIELTKHIHSINKLSIRNLQVNEDELLQISANCSAITHLDVDGTQITVQAMLKMKQLQIVFDF